MTPTRLLMNPGLWAVSWTLLPCPPQLGLLTPYPWRWRPVVTSDLLDPRPDFKLKGEEKTRQGEQLLRYSKRPVRRGGRATEARLEKGGRSPRKETCQLHSSSRIPQAMSLLLSAIWKVMGFRSFYAKSTPFENHFLIFTGLLGVTFIHYPAHLPFHPLLLLVLLEHPSRHQHLPHHLLLLLPKNVAMPAIQLLSQQITPNQIGKTKVLCNKLLLHKTYSRTAVQLYSFVTAA